MSKWATALCSIVLVLVFGGLVFYMHPKKHLVLDPPPQAREQVVADEIQKLRGWLATLPSDDVVKLQEAGRIEYPYESFKAQYPEFDKQLTYCLTHDGSIPKDYKLAIKSVCVIKFRGNAYQVHIFFKPSGEMGICAAGNCSAQ